MSRMIAVVSAVPATLDDTVGSTRLRAFAHLAEVHADGWGWAGVDDRGRLARHVSTSRLTDATALSRVAAPVRVGAAYLRFASAGSPVAEHNVQPFVSGAGVGFCHNGALIPAAHAREMLSSEERARLQGTTDSEAYFTVIGRALPVDDGDPAALLDAIAAGARTVRSAFPDACVNAFVLHPSGLAVVQSAGTRPPPLAAFAARGHDLEALPPGHDDGYNRMWTRSVAGGARLVATSGLDMTGWDRLAEDTVFWFGAAGGQVRSCPL